MIYLKQPRNFNQSLKLWHEKVTCWRLFPMTQILKLTWMNQFSIMEITQTLFLYCIGYRRNDICVTAMTLQQRKLHVSWNRHLFEVIANDPNIENDITQSVLSARKHSNTFVFHIGYRSNHIVPQPWSFSQENYICHETSCQKALNTFWTGGIHYKYWLCNNWAFQPESKVITWNNHFKEVWFLYPNLEMGMDEFVGHLGKHPNNFVISYWSHKQKTSSSKHYITSAKKSRYDMKQSILLGSFIAPNYGRWDSMVRSQS